jgi:hypothetical protein
MFSLRTIYVFKVSGHRFRLENILKNGCGKGRHFRMVFYGFGLHFGRLL